MAEFANHSSKGQAEVIAFAAEHPGALTAFFLGMVHQRMSQGVVRRSSDLRRGSVVAWAERHSGLSELRDQRELLTLATAMDLINDRQLESAMDVLSQRISSLQAAKTKGGSWEKSSRIELTTTPGSGAQPSGLLKLTT